MCSPVLDWSKIKFSHWELNGIIISLSHICVVSEVLDVCALKLFCKSVLIVRYINCYDMAQVNASNQREDCPQAVPAKKPRLCDVSLWSSRSREHQQGVAVLACLAPAFLLWVVPEHRYVPWIQSWEERRLLHLFGGKHTLARVFQLHCQAEKRGGGMCWDWRNCHVWEAV